MKHYYLLMGLLASLYACSDSFPTTQDVKNDPTTMMVVAMEEEVDWNKNILYCPTVLYAWDEIKSILTLPFEIENKEKELLLLHNSTGHVGALEEGDYEKKVKIGVNVITVNTSLSAELLLETPLEKEPINMKFDGKDVLCFGGYGDAAPVFNQVKFLFYESPEEFAIILSPKDKSQELLLYRTSTPKGNSLTSLYHNLKEKRAAAAGTRGWIEDDFLAIPVLAYNLEKEYEEFKKVPFNTPEGGYNVEKVWQRIALTLNETGAKVESEAEVVVSTRAAVKSDGRSLIFDDDFLLVIKKKDAEQPYLLTWVSNPAFMSPRAQETPE